MNMKFLSAAAFATATMVAAPAMATTVIFDDFTGTQQAVDTPFPGSSNSDTVAFNSGTRTLNVTNIQNNGLDVAATSLQVASGALSFSNADQATGTGELVYTNVGDIQLDDDPSRSFFLFDVGVFDAVAQFSVTATDGNGFVSTFSETLLPGFDPQLFFSEFAGTADFNDIATLSFSIDSENVPFFGPQFALDGSLNSISIGAVPLPASGILLIGALGGVAAMRRRKAQKKA